MALGILAVANQAHILRDDQRVGTEGLLAVRELVPLRLLVVNQVIRNLRRLDEIMKLPLLELEPKFHGDGLLHGHPDSLRAASARSRPGKLAQPVLPLVSRSSERKGLPDADPEDPLAG